MHWTDLKFQFYPEYKTFQEIKGIKQKSLADQFRAFEYCSNRIVVKQKQLHLCMYINISWIGQIYLNLVLRLFCCHVDETPTFLSFENKQDIGDL